jgi:hypothetical protein
MYFIPQTQREKIAVLLAEHTVLWGELNTSLRRLIWRAMKRTTLASTFLAALFLTALALAQPANADIVDDDETRLASGPYIVFPLNTTYNSRFVTLDISFSAQLFSKVRFSATYSLDGTPTVIVPLVSSPSLVWNKNHVTGSISLPELSDGSHRLSVYVEADAGTGESYWDSETVYFTVEATPPKIKVLSPLNQTYTETSVSLVFTLDRQANWTGYSVDNEENVTVTGNASLTGLLNRLHNLTVYSNNTYGNMGASETISFTVAVPELFPFVPVAVASATTAAVVAIGVLVYFKKRKH